MVIFFFPFQKKSLFYMTSETLRILLFSLCFQAKLFGKISRVIKMSRKITKIFLHVLYLFPVSSVKIEKEYHESKLHLKSSHRFGAQKKRNIHIYFKGFLRRWEKGKTKRNMSTKANQKIKMYKIALMIHCAIWNM